jgi:hypothetical protein
MYQIGALMEIKVHISNLPVIPNGIGKSLGQLSGGR